MLQGFHHFTDSSEEPRDWKKGQEKAEKSSQRCKQIKSHLVENRHQQTVRMSMAPD